MVSQSLLKKIFVEAMELDPRELGEFLTKACGGDKALQAEIVSLLNAHQNATHFFDPDVPSSPQALLGNSQAVDPDRFEWMILDEQPGSSIDRYKLLEIIGKGGHGVVFHAEQEQPIRRQVALKVIRKGMETQSARLRFESERQTLALMDHPNIAKLFDAGTTESNRPYFVMELVRGDPLTQFCDNHQLPIRRRVELFITICRAVHHAHQKGVIHRDLKPSNILVSESEGIASAKVIDFGISLATSDALIDLDDRQIVGTPQYMSPEQVATENVAIDIRSDVYSLGAMLHELLTGVTPIGRDTHPITTVQELRDAFASDYAIRPSETVLRKSISCSPSSTNAIVPHNRAVALPVLIRSLQQDLDCIVLKSIHRERSLRYDSVAALADDLQRYLDRRPVLAAPGTASYIFHRFAARNKATVILGLGIAASVIASLFAVSLALIQMRAARDRAIISQQHEERSEAQAVGAEKLKAASEADAISKLRESYVQQAMAGERSRVPGQRTSSLQAIALAAKIYPSSELRNIAIACMTLPDVQRGDTWRMPQLDTFVGFTDQMDQYAVSARDGSLKLFRRSDRQQIAQFAGTGKPLFGIPAFSPNGKYIGILDHYGLHILDVSTQKTILSRDTLSAFAFTKDGRSLVIGTPDGALDIFSLPDLEKIRSIPDVGFASNCRLNPSGNKLAVWSDDEGLRIVNMIGPTETRKIETDVSPIAAIAWQPQGYNIAVAGFESLGRIEILNAETGKLQASMSGHVATPVDVAYTNSGRFLLSCGWDGHAMLWDPANGTQLLSVGNCIGGLQIAKDDSEFSVSGPADHQTWHFTTGRECKTLIGQINDGTVVTTDIDSSETFLAAATNVGVRIWNLQTANEVCFISVPGPRSVLFNPDGSTLFITSATGVSHFDVTKLIGREDPIEEAANHGNTGALGASADFKTMVFGAPDGTVRIASPDQLDSSEILGRHYQTPRFVAVSADGLWGASSARFEKPKVWNLKTKMLEKELPLSPNIREAGQVAFDPSGKVLVASDVAAYRWYSVGDWKLIREIDMPNPGLVEFSPDAKLVALGAPGFSILLLDAQTGEELATLDTPLPHNPGSIHFSRDSRFLVLGGAGDEIILWDLPNVRRTLRSMNLDWK